MSQAKDERIVPYELLWVFLLVVVAIVAVCIFYYRSYERRFRTGVERQLSAVAELKVEELAQWRKERLEDADFIFNNTPLAGLVRRFFQQPGVGDAAGLLRAWLEKLQGDRYDRVSLLDTNGLERLAAPETTETAGPYMAREAIEALRSGKPAFLDFHRDAPGRPVHIDILVPIFDEADGNRSLGVLVLGIQPAAYLYPLISRWPTPSQTAEALLVRRDRGDALFLNNLKFQTNTALNLRSSLENTSLPAVKAALGQEGIVEGRDYRGAPVVAALRRVPDSPWFLVARMDTAEVYAPLRERLWLTALIAAVLLLGAGASMAAVWRHQFSQTLEQRVIERTAQLKAANEELEAFCYSVSHDLRAPLRAIDGFARTLVEEYTPRLDGEGKRIVDIVCAEARRMGRLIDDLLAFSRLGRQRVQPSPIDMAALARNVFDECAAQAPGRKVQFRLGPLSPVSGDAAMLRQALANLLSNAIKFTRPKDVAEIEFGGRTEGRENLYYVRDNGVGFDMRYSGKLFGVFQRLHAEDEFEGTGVGLALVQRVIHRHGGRVWAEGRINQGATFHFALPSEGKAE
jgi:signal transduction histidine kinase